MFVTLWQNALFENPEDLTVNSYERAMTVLRGGIPDRVPSFELMIDPAVITSLMGYDDYMDFCDFMDLDLVVAPTPSKLYRETAVDREKGVYRNEWGIVRQYGAEVVSIVREGPIRTLEDLERYQAPDPLDEYRFSALRALVGRFKGRRMIGMILHDSFSYPCYLRGMENLFMDLFDHPDWVRRLVDLSVEHNIAMARKAAEIGADFIVLGDDYGAKTSLLISPEQFREFFLPGLIRIVREVKAAGLFCLKHCCGNINAVLEDIVASGIDGIHPLDANAGMDMAGVKEKYLHLTVIGGIDCNEPLSAFTPQEMEREVKRVLGLFAPEGRYIAATSNSVHSSAKPENFAAMQKAIREYGSYSSESRLSRSFESP